MRRFVPLILVVLAFAAVPAAATAGDRPAPAAPSVLRGDRPANKPFLRLRLIQLQLQAAMIRHRLACGRDPESERCAAFKAKAVERLTALDEKVQEMIDMLEQCTEESSEPYCENADKKIDALGKISDKSNRLIDKLSE